MSNRKEKLGMVDEYLFDKNEGEGFMAVLWEWMEGKWRLQDGVEKWQCAGGKEWR